MMAVTIRILAKSANFNCIIFSGIVTDLVFWTNGDLNDECKLTDTFNGCGPHRVWSTTEKISNPVYMRVYDGNDYVPSET